MMQAASIDAMGRTDREMPLAGNFRLAEMLHRIEQRIDRDDLVTVAMHQQDRRLALGIGLEMLRPDEMAGIGDNRPGITARRRPTCNAIIAPWLKPTKASRCGGTPVRASSCSRNASRSGPACWQPRQRSEGSRMVSGHHCRPTGAMPQGSGACGDTNAASGSKSAQLWPRSIRSFPSAP